MPNQVAIQLVKSDISNVSQTQNDSPLRIRIEKDYNCLRGQQATTPSSNQLPHRP